MKYKRLSLWKYEKELKNKQIEADIVLFMDNAFNFYLEIQLNKANLWEQYKSK